MTKLANKQILKILTNNINNSKLRKIKLQLKKINFYIFA